MLSEPHYFDIKTIVSTCLEEIKKMPFEPNGALAVEYLKITSYLSVPL
jgi:hypothetical protein